MVQVILINGLSTSGKSTFASLTQAYCTLNYPSVIVSELSTVDIIKTIARCVGWQGGKSAKDRVFLNDLKNAFAKWDGRPVKSVFENIKALINSNPDKDIIVFVNSREPEDHIKIKKQAEKLGYKVCRVLIKRTGVDAATTNEVPELVEGILNAEYDKVIENDAGLEEFVQKATDFAVELMADFYL